MRRVRGGVAANIAYNMSLLSGHPRIMATVGEDFEEYRAWLEAKGVDTSLMEVVPDEFTSSFFATTDQDSAQLASFYPGAMRKASEQSLVGLTKKPDLVAISPTDPLAMMKFASECRELGIPYLYDPSQQVPRLSGEELARDINGAHFLFCNDYEYNLINVKTSLCHERIMELVKVLVVTRGKDGAYLYTEGREYFIPTIPEEEIVDPTGVGDAFRGGFIVGYSPGWDWVLCGQVGALSAVYCLECRGPQGQKYTKEEFITRFRKHFDDKGKLDELLVR
ncbi:MAG: carbohydrate kinase family protein [Rectinemataceae bacterium]